MSGFPIFIYGSVWANEGKFYKYSYENYGTVKP